MALDDDLEHMDTERLLKEVKFLTGKLKQREPMHVRRTRAMRILRRQGVVRERIAEVADITPSGINNLITSLEKKEAAEQA